MWFRGCFCGFSSTRKPTKSSDFYGIENGTAGSATEIASSAAASLPLVEASNLSAEWAGSQFPVACVALGNPDIGRTAPARRVTVLWHNARSEEIWECLTNAATNPALAEAIEEIARGALPTQQVVLVAGSTFTAQAAQPAAAAARFTSELLAAVSVPVHVSPVQFSTGSQGVVLPRAVLLVCRAPLMPPRHLDAGPAARSFRSLHLAPRQVQHLPGPAPHTAAGATATLPATTDLGAGSGRPGGVQHQQQEAVVAAHRQRDSMVAAHLPAVITVFTLDGQVLHQNPSSVQYMGSAPSTRPYGFTTLSNPATGERTVATTGLAGAGGEDVATANVPGLPDSPGAEEVDWTASYGVLGLVFIYEQTKLRQMMDVLLGRGNVWQGIVRVPTSESLQQKLFYGSRAMHPAPLLEEAMERLEAEAEAACPPPGSDLAAAAPSPLPPWDNGTGAGYVAAPLEPQPPAWRDLSAEIPDQYQNDHPRCGQQQQQQETQVSQHHEQRQQDGRPRSKREEDATHHRDHQHYRERQQKQQRLEADRGSQQLQPDEQRAVLQEQQQTRERQQPGQHRDRQQRHPDARRSLEQREPPFRSSDSQDRLQQDSQQQHNYRQPPHPQPPLQHHQHRQRMQDLFQAHAQVQANPLGQALGHSQPHAALLDNSATSATLNNAVTATTLQNTLAIVNNNSSSSYVASGSRSTYYYHQYQPHQQQPRAHGHTGEVSMGMAGGSEVTSAAVHDGLPGGRGTVARASVANMYDAEADPLATSTWTVLSDSASRGWLSGQQPVPARTNVAGWVGSSQRSPLNAPRSTFRRARHSAAPHSPDGGREPHQADAAAAAELIAADAAAAEAAALGLVCRWGSMTSYAARPPVASGPPAEAPLPLLPGVSSGMNAGVVTSDGGERGEVHDSQPFADDSAPEQVHVPMSGREARGRPLASVGRSLDTVSAAAAVAEDAVGLSGRTLVAARTTAAFESSAVGLASPRRRLEASHDGGGGGAGVGFSSMTLRRGEGTVTAVVAGLNHAPGTGSGTANNATSISRVLIFANSLRSAPFASASAATPSVISSSAAGPQLGALPAPGRSAHELGGPGIASSRAGGGGGDGQSHRALSSTAMARKSKSCDRALAAAVTAPSPLERITPNGNGSPVQITSTALEEPPMSPAPARPEMSALLWARRSTLAKQAAGAAAVATAVERPLAPPAAATDTADQAAAAALSAGASAEDTARSLVAAAAAGAPADVAAAATTTAASEAPSPEEPRTSAVGDKSVPGPTPLQRPSCFDGGRGSTVRLSSALVTAGEAELAMALLPFRTSMASSQRQRGQGVAASRGGAEDGDGDGGGGAADGVPLETMDGGGGSGGGEHDVWHEISAVSALDPVTGAAVLVVTQVDVTAKVRAERHLVHVMCAERRLLLQLFPRHVLQHVVEANPLLNSHHAAATGAGPLESLPREWLDGGDWRPVLRDCDKLATMHPQATVLFADIAGFDDICMELLPQTVLAFLNDLFAKFDSSIEPFGVHKMETIGGLFIVAGGLLREEEDGAVAVRDRWDPLHAEKVFMFAKAMLNVAAKTKLPTLEQQPVKLRIGIHTGAVMSGIVGTRVPRFVLFGDTVNTASRMQTSATPGTVHVSEDTRALLPHENWTPTGGVQIKGKGLLNTYVWLPEDQIHYLVPPAVSTPESTHVGRASGAAAAAAAAVAAAARGSTAVTGSGSAGTNSSGGAAPAAAAAAAAVNGSRYGGGGGAPPAMLLSTMDTLSCTSSDAFLAQQLSFTSAIPVTLTRGKSRLRNEGGYL